MTDCSCIPCLEPGNGGPTPGHCAACCGQSGIVEYDRGCPVVEHQRLAALQFPDFADLGCSECGGDLDPDGACVDCGYDEADDPPPEDWWMTWADGEMLAAWTPPAQLGPIGKAALG